MWWLKRSRKRQIERPAGTLHSTGYIKISVDRAQLLGHIVVWAMMTGAWPQHDLDHRDGCRSNNRWENLRTATPSQNGANKKVMRRGLKGVDFRNGRWCARIKANGRRIRLGCFDTEAKAHAAYVVAAQKYHGEFARPA